MNKTENNKLIRTEKGVISRSSRDKDVTRDPHVLKHDFLLENKCYAVRSVTICPNDRYLIITNDLNPKIRVVDLELLEYQKHAYEGHSQSVRLTSCTPDGKYFFSGSWDSTARKYSFETGQCMETYEGFFGRCPSVFVDPKLKYLFLACYDAYHGGALNNCGWCVDLATKRVIVKYMHHHTRLRPEAIDIAYDQKAVFTGSDDGVGMRWDLLTGAPVLQYFKTPGYTVRKIAVTRKYFAAASSDGRVRVFRKESGKPVVEYVHSSFDEVRDLKISQDETKLFSASADGTVMCHDLVLHKTIFHRTVHAGAIWSICLMNSDKILVSGSTDGTIGFTGIKGELLARLMNLANNDFLVESPPDKAYLSGFFYSTNKDLVNVYRHYNNTEKRENLAMHDKQRIRYVDAINKKHLIMTKLKNNAAYDKMTAEYSHQKKMLAEIKKNKLPLLLDS